MKFSQLNTALTEMSNAAKHHYGITHSDAKEARSL